MTKSYYQELVQANDPFFPYRSIWNPRIPSKVSFFLWNTYLDNILTLNHLQSRGWNLANRCVMCMREEESINLLFIHCLIVFMVWTFFLSHLHIFWTFPKYFCDMVDGGFGDLSFSHLVCFVWCCLLGFVEREELLDFSGQIL